MIVVLMELKEVNSTRFHHTKFDRNRTRVSIAIRITTITIAVGISGIDIGIGSGIGIGIGCLGRIERKQILEMQRIWKGIVKSN